MRKYKQQQKLKQELMQIQQKNEQRRLVLQEQKQKVDQRQLSKILVNAFKASVDQVMQEKQNNSKGGGARSETHIGHGSNTSQVDKRRILETFVENDEALGQLLDFISTKSGSEAAPPSQQQQAENSFDPTVSMTIVDRQGNKI